MSLLRSTGIAPELFGFDRSMRQMMNAMDRMVNDVYGGAASPLALTGSSSDPTTSGALTSFSPRVDLKETDKTIEIKADLPGIPKESVKIEARDNMLLISGETHKETEKKDERGTYHYRERFQGSFRRAIAMPPTANLEAVKAKFDHGVLCIEVPKKEEQGGRQITIE
ncbi:HSP20-like chaperone [Catenaria anguillulae PL171]|uniref:HSP20-like chaperone n=1 Tax=Catenaria anguillulae PL171 TaxID=765915 RepID=A0A1Y2H3Q2_9FUNG|nr:HSP20-like chaperone [Catenaria anguillulae PL171]ORZ31548.1 HSP20-like chaperone [Catenaria anguillulae PL171]